MSSAGHRLRGLFAFEYYPPMFYSKPIAGLTVYLRWKRLFLFVSFNTLNGQPECDRHCEGSRPNRKTGIPRAFTQIAQEATRQDYLHEVGHMRKRVVRLEQAVTEASNRHRPRYNRSSRI
jgi:hypothetical protein